MLNGSGGDCKPHWVERLADNSVARLVAQYLFPALLTLLVYWGMDLFHTLEHSINSVSAKLDAVQAQGHEINAAVAALRTQVTDNKELAEQKIQSVADRLNQLADSVRSRVQH